MSYFTSSGYKQSPNIVLWALVALISALIGGVLVLTVAPGYIATRAGLLAEAAPTGTSSGTSAAGTPVSTTPGPIEWTGDWPATAVADAVGPSVVGIVGQTTYVDWFQGQRTQEQGGSGVVFKQANGYSYIGTNQHVIDQTQKLWVVLADGQRHDAELVGEDWWTDLAVVRVKDTSLKVAAFGDSDQLKVGELVMAIGNPVDMEFQRSVTVGVVSGLNRKVSYSDEREFSLIQTDAAINPGNSGGPLVNTSGQVVGINNMKIASTNVENMGFAIPSNLAQRIFNDLIMNGRVIRPYLGVSILSAADARQYYGMNIEKGIYVANVVAGSPASRAGIAEGDIITKIDGQETNTLGDLRRILDMHKPKDVVPVEIVRNGQTRTVQATLIEAPETTG